MVTAIKRAVVFVAKDGWVSWAHEISPDRDSVAVCGVALAGAVPIKAPTPDGDDWCACCWEGVKWGTPETSGLSRTRGMP